MDRFENGMEAGSIMVWRVNIPKTKMWEIPFKRVMGDIEVFPKTRDPFLGVPTMRPWGYRRT